MKAKLLPIALALLALTAMNACGDSDPPHPDPQDIVYEDTSGMTGELAVEVFYEDGSIYQANGSYVFLYANREDLDYDLTVDNNNSFAIYRIYTASDNIAYFGYINYGNYYVLAYNYIDGREYDKYAIVQVRPQREELLRITMERVP